MPIPRKTSEPPNLHPDPVALNAILSVEGVPLSSYALMLALERENGRALRCSKLSACAGVNYYAVRNQLRRTPYFNTHRVARIREVHVTLADEGREKLTLIRQRLDRYASPK